MRADKYFAERFGSRTKAHDLLAQGLILRNGKPLSPKDEVFDGDDIYFAEEKERYVSRGGFKLARGFSVFSASPEGKIFADLGASTGGFTDCLLQNGAKRVYCVDVGESQLAPALLRTGKVVVMDGTNARYLTRDRFPEPIDGVVSDLSFISLKLILPAVVNILPDGGEAFLLFKPQFECEGKGLGKSGILPPARHSPLLRKFYAEACACGLFPQDVINAPLRPKKNVEYVVFLVKGRAGLSEAKFLARAANFYENRKNF